MNQFNVKCVKSIVLPARRCKRQLLASIWYADLSRMLMRHD
jgi:hypothetical protein